MKKEIVQGTKSERKETRTQINDLEQKEEINILPKQNEEKRIKKKMAQMKEQIKAPEKIQLNGEEIANLSDAQFKTLVIRMFTEMVDYGHKIEEKVKAMK